jgi:hypothetical protein
MQKYKPETPRTVRGNTISLVEKPLDTRIDDYRKNALVNHQITKSATNRSCSPGSIPLDRISPLTETLRE